MQYSSTTHAHSLIKRQLYTYLRSEGRLVLPLSVAEFGGLCMRFEDKTTIGLCTLVVWTPNPTSNWRKDAWYCLHRLQSSTRSVHNSSQNQLCTYKTSYSKTRLRNSVHNSRKNQLYINLPSSREQLGLRVFTHCVSYALIFNHT